MSCEANQAVRPDAPPSFVHLRRLTDDTGMLEHAQGRIPRRKEGYTADDNARALWTVTEWLNLDGYGEAKMPESDRTELMRLADTYIAYLLWSQHDNGWIHNNIAYDRTPEHEERSHDCQGRTIWACADAWVRLAQPARATARFLIERAMPTLGHIDSHRGQAFAMAACAHLLDASDCGVVSLPSDVRSELQHHMLRFEAVLTRAFDHFDDGRWRWFEPAMTYGNGVLPWAMLRTYRYTRRSGTLAIGLESLVFLLERMTAEGGWLRPIGNESWCTHDRSSRWDQQPLEMFKLALALEEAALIAQPPSRGLGEALVGASSAATGIEGNPAHAHPPGNGGEKGPRENGFYPLGDASTHYRAIRDLCRDWYYGNNDLRAPLVDPSDGSCCDGLTRYGPNLNCGAEATISYLMTEALCRR
ncbi:hypothetical protein [Cohnella yongneupensis]|uniref:Glycosyltransferase n=1 Tax=Cohnella yongneupensis TaxID=425006 RepID=A0ABW0R1I4_9BACL